MSAIFSSWKEIANYLGKGVRTVQRWEQQLGLPVHRPSRGGKGIVIAYSDELEIWVRKHAGEEVQSRAGRSSRHVTTELGLSLQERMTKLAKNTAHLVTLTRRAVAVAGKGHRPQAPAKMLEPIPFAASEQTSAPARRGLILAPAESNQARDSHASKG